MWERVAVLEGHCEDRSHPDCPRRFLSKKRRKYDFLCIIYFYFCFVIIWYTNKNTKYLLVCSVGENCKMQKNFSIFPKECLRQAPGIPDIHLFPCGANDIFLRDYYHLNEYSCSFQAIQISLVSDYCRLFLCNSKKLG